LRGLDCSVSVQLSEPSSGIWRNITYKVKRAWRLFMFKE
jgi:hypothetical protein